MKICNKCKIEKDELEFRFRSGKSINQCRKCERATCKEYHKNNYEKDMIRSKKYKLENKERLKEQTKAYHEKYKERLAACAKKYIEQHKEEINKNKRERNLITKEERKLYKDAYYQEHKEQSKQYYEENKERISKIHKQYYSDNKDVKKQYTRQYVSNRRATDINYKIAVNLRSRLYCAIKNNQKVGSAVQDLGCTVEELKRHLEQRFYLRKDTGEQMTWENYKHDGWHIDHIVPLCSFDLTDREQFLKACHYINLQPLWAEDNLSKGGRV